MTAPKLAKKRYFKLIGDLNSQQAFRRRKALGALAAADDPRTPGPVSRRLFDVEPALRQIAAEVLERHGLGLAAEAVLRLFAEGEQARASAVETLEPMLSGPMPEPHVGAIIATALGLHELFDSIAAIGATHEERYVRRAAIEGLYQVNQPTLSPAFVLPSVDTDAGVRRYAAVGLAENNLLIGAGRLCRDPDVSVARAASKAFARPGQPVLVRDPHRRVMEQSDVFAFPQCGSSLLSGDGFPRLGEKAALELNEGNLRRADAALRVLLLLGRPLADLRDRVANSPHPQLLRQLEPRPEAPDGASAGVVAEPALAGRKLLLVGGDGVESHLVAALGRAGLDVTWLSGFDNEAARTTGARFDAVLVLTKRVSHAAAEHGVRIGEGCGAVVLHVHTTGQSTVLEAAREALGGIDE